MTDMQPTHTITVTLEDGVIQYIEGIPAGVKIVVTGE
jgi:hypothetical protein